MTPTSDRAERRGWACRRRRSCWRPARQTHAARLGGHPETTVEVAGRALIDYCLDGLAARRRRDGGRQRPLPRGPRRGAPAAPQGAEDRHLRRARCSAGDRRRDQPSALPLLGDAPFLVRNADSFWLEGVRPNLAWLAGGWDEARMDGSCSSPPRSGRSAIPAAAISSWRRTGGLTRRPERTVAPFVYAGAAIFSRRLFDNAPEGAFSLNVPVRPRHRGRAAVRRAA